MTAEQRHEVYIVPNMTFRTYRNGAISRLTYKIEKITEYHDDGNFCTGLKPGDYLQLECTSDDEVCQSGFYFHLFKGTYQCTDGVTTIEPIEYARNSQLNLFMYLKEMK